MNIIVIALWLIGGLFGQAHAKQQVKPFNDIVLIVNFNHPYYKNIDILNALYADIFGDVIFYGEKQGSRVISVPTRTGYLLHDVIKDACERFPQAKGYLFLQDDCVLHFWNLMHLDQEKIWYAVAFNDGLSQRDKFYSILNPAGQCQGFWWDKWGYDCGFGAAHRAYRQLNSRYVHKIQENVGKDFIPANMCEVFYVPSKFRESFLELNEIFKDVFCEIAVPSMLCCLDSIHHWEKLNMLGGAGVGLGGPDSPALANYPMEVSWVHPIKFSYKENQERMLDIFQKIKQKIIR